MDITSILIGGTLVVWGSLVVVRLLRKPVPPPGAPTADGVRSKAEEALAGWCPILSEGRALTGEELEKYADFVGLARAWSAAAAEGRPCGPNDIREACGWRDARVAESATIRRQMEEAARARVREREATGGKDGPAGVRANELATRYERCLRDAGEINVLRDWRRGLDDRADELRVGDLLPTFILEDPRGLLTPAERRYMYALSRASKGDADDLRIAARLMEWQSGSDALTPAQAARIVAAIERGEGRSASDGSGEDPAVVAYLDAEDTYWSGRVERALEPRAPDGPACPSREETARFRAFIAARHAAGAAKASGRPASRFTKSDLDRGNTVRQEKAAAAAALVPRLKEAHERWRADVEPTGTSESDAGESVRALSQQVEDLAWNGGDLDTFMWALSWRFSKLGAAGGEHALPSRPRP